MNSSVILVALMLLALVPINAQQQPVILPEPVPIEEGELPAASPGANATQPQEPIPEQPSPEMETPKGGVLDAWESAFGAMLQSGSVVDWIGICCSAGLSTIPYIPGLFVRVLRLLPLSCMLVVRFLRALPSFLRNAWAFVCALPQYISAFMSMAQQMIDLLMVCVRILPQMMSSQSQQQGGQNSLAQLLPLLGALMG
jgi:hypothetical protein